MLGGARRNSEDARRNSEELGGCSEELGGCSEELGGPWSKQYHTAVAHWTLSACLHFCMCVCQGFTNLENSNYLKLSQKGFRNAINTYIFSFDDFDGCVEGEFENPNKMRTRSERSHESCSAITTAGSRRLWAVSEAPA